MKRLLLAFMVVLSINLANPRQAFAEESTSIEIKNIINDTITMPRADIIKWRYKNIKGKAHRRQYNYTKKKWIGKWEPI